MSEPTLHPNLAKLAAAYDEILERLGRGQVTAAAARAEIAQLEARDDQGVRWSIDPDDGEWVRKTALGDVEYDAAPPTYGYMTPDAFDYTHNPQVFNPADRLQLAEVNEQLEHGPSSLAGATRTSASGRGQVALSTVVDRVSAASTRAKAIGAAAAIALMALVLHGCGGEEPAKAPQPSVTAPAKAPAKTTGKAKAKPPAKPTPSKKG